MPQPFRPPRPSRRQAIAVLLGLAAALFFLTVPSLHSALRDSGLLITARVRGPEGRPLAEAEVDLSPLPSSYAQGLRDLALAPEIATQRTTTDPQGELRLHVPSPGMWSVRVTAAERPPIVRHLTPVFQDLDLGTAALPPEESPSSPPRAALSHASPGWQRLLTTARSTAGQGWHPEPSADVTVTLLRPSGEGWPNLLLRHATTGDAVALTDERGQVLLPSGSRSRWTVEAADGWRLEIALPREQREIVIDSPPALVGRVTAPSRARTLEAAAGAWVWAEIDPGAAVRTDASGRFRLPFPGSGRQAIQIATPHHFPRRLWLDLKEEEATGPVEIELEPSATWAGQVMSSFGEPLAGARIEVEAARPSDEPSRGSWVGFSSPPGRFLIPHVAPGQAYRLRVSHEGFVDLEISAVAPQAQRLVLHPARRLVGWVLDDRESPLSGAHIRLDPNPSTTLGPPPEVSVLSDDRGRFELTAVAPGEYELRVDCPGFAPIRLPHLAVAEEPGPLEIGTLVLLPAATLDGRVVDGGGGEIAGARVGAWPATEALEDAQGAALEPRWSEVTGRDGRFRLSDLPPGQHLRLWVTHDGYAEARIDDVRVPLPEPLVVLLAPGARLRGSLRTEDGEVPRSARAELRPAGTVRAGGVSSPTPTHTRVVAVDTDGTFVFEAVPRGSFDLVASAPGYRPVARSVEILDDEEPAPLELLLRAGAELRGAIFDREGRPVPEARLHAHGQAPSADASPSALAEALTETDGTYRLRGLPPGEMRLLVDHPGYEPIYRTLDLPDGESRLDLTLEEGPEIEGRVIAEGEGVPGARVSLLRDLGDPVDTVNSSEGGRFVFPRVRRGRYRLRAAHPDYGPATPSEPLEVAEAPVTGVELELTSPASVHGRLLGLALEDLVHAEVGAARDGSGMVMGNVESDGSFRVPGLSSGEWTVAAWTGPRGARAEARVTLPVGSAEVEVDLDLGQSLSLAGKVLLDHRPLSGAQVAVEGVDVSRTQATISDPQGRFSFEGLAAGTYRLMVTGPEPGLRFEETQRLTRSRDDLILRARGAALSGQVLDADTGTPLGGALVGVDPSRFADGSPTLVTGSDGRFRFASLAAGAHRLVARKDGYAAAETEVEILPGASPPHLELLLAPSTGLRLELRDASGRPPAEARLALVDDRGQPLLSGVFPLQEDGELLLPSAPPGRWLLVVATDTSAPLSLHVAVPESTPRLLLPPGGGVQLEVPELTGSSTLAQVHLETLQGEALLTVDWSGRLQSTWPLVAGKATIYPLPVGTWRLRVESPTGGSWQGEAEVVEGLFREVTLP